MFAARREHLEQVIGPALARGDMGDLRSLHRRDVRLPGRRAMACSDRPSPASSRSCTAIATPDLTLLFDVPLDVSRERLARAASNGRALDKFEREQQALLRAGARCVPRACRRRARRAFASIDSTRSARRRARNACSALLARDRRLMAATAADDAPVAAAALAGAAAMAGRRRARRARAAAARPGRMRCSCTGSAGIGKRTLALNFARALLCEAPRRRRQRMRRLPELRLRRRRAASRLAPGRAVRRDDDGEVDGPRRHPHRARPRADRMDAASRAIAGGPRSR